MRRELELGDPTKVESLDCAIDGANAQIFEKKNFNQQDGDEVYDRIEKPNVGQIAQKIPLAPVLSSAAP